MSTDQDAERIVVAWYLARREADPRASIVRPVHLPKFGAQWQSALDGSPVFVVLPSPPDLSAETVAAAERHLVSAWARRHAAQAMRAAVAALEAGGDAGAVAGDVSRALAEAAAGGLVRSETHRELVGQILEQWIGDMASRPRTIPLPWKQIQAHTGGLPLGKLVILGGRSSEHKTSTAREIAEGAARWCVEHGGHAVYWTLEDSSRDVAGRTIADAVNSLTTRDLLTATHKGLRPSALALQQIADEVRAHVSEPWTDRLRYLDEPNATRSRVMSTISAEAARGARLIVLDYFHLIRPDRGPMDADAARTIATELHGAAKTHGLAILALAQLDKTSTIASAAEKRVPQSAELLFGSMLKQTAFGTIMVGLAQRQGWLDVVVEKWKAADPNVAFGLRVDAPHDRILDP